MAKLPLEIVFMIFMHCLPYRSLYSREWSQDKSYRRALFTLGAICNSWRQAVWSNACFWAYIPLTIKFDKITQTTAMVQEWMERSKALPLTVKIAEFWDYRKVYSQWDIVRGDLRKFVQFANIINACSDRWQHLFLSIPTIFLRQFTGRPANLKSIHIDNTNWYHHRQDDAILEIEAPLLNNSRHLALAKLENTEQKPEPRSLSFTRTSLKWIDASWTNLVDVTAEDIDTVDFFRLLREAPHLEQLLLEQYRYVPDETHTIREEIAPVVHGALVKLTIKAMEAQFLDTVFGHNILSLPGLKSLTIDLAGSPFNPECFVVFMKRSSCSLSQLSLTAPFTNYSKLISMLETVPHLTHLYLSPTRPQFTAESLFKHLVQTSRTQPLVVASNDAPASSGARFLPILKSHHYLPISLADCEKIWELIPDIFGVEFFDTVPNTVSNIDDSSRRQLMSLSISYKPECESHLKCPPPTFSARALSCFKQLVRYGVSMNLLTYHREPEDWHTEVQRNIVPELLTCLP